MVGGDGIRRETWSRRRRGHPEPMDIPHHMPPITSTCDLESATVDRTTISRFSQ